MVSRDSKRVNEYFLASLRYVFVCPFSLLKSIHVVFGLRQHGHHIFLELVYVNPTQANLDTICQSSVLLKIFQFVNIHLLQLLPLKSLTGVDQTNFE